MMGILLKKTFRPLLASAGAVMFCAAAALAQTSATSPAPSSTTPAVRSDGQIEMDVVHALDAAPSLKNDLITAATIESEVTLSGTVSSDASKKLAESIVAGVSGVTKVHDNLKVGDPTAAAQTSEPSPSDEGMPGQDQSQQDMSGLPPSGPSAQSYPGQPPLQNQPPDAQQGPYSQSRPPYQSPQYAQAPQSYQQQYPPTPNYQPATGPVTLRPGTLLQLRTSEPVDSKHAQPGQPVQFLVIQDVTMGGVLAIPRGAVVHGVVTDSKNVGSGQMAGSSSLALTLTSLDLGGHNYPIQADEFRVKAPNKAGQTVGSALTGGILGTMIGCIVGRGVGCAVGAGAGVAAGTAAGTVAPGPRAWIPAEALVTFHLAAPVTVDPVSPQEAQRLAQGLYPGGPALYRRSPNVQPYYGYGYAPMPYGYPAPFYHPYVMMGGAYYWR